jgi:hypothetical protein
MFCTFGSGLSWPSIAPVCRPVYVSAKAIGVGFAPSERPRSCHASPGGMRSLMPAMSAGVLIFFFGFRPT